MQIAGGPRDRRSQLNERHRANLVDPGLPRHLQPTLARALRHDLRRPRLRVAFMPLPPDPRPCHPPRVTAVLRAHGLGHRVPGRSLFADLSLDLHPGRITAVVGPNGAGKSTLLRLLAGLDSPQHGSVHLGDDDLRALPARLRARRLAYLPQRTDLAYDLRLHELVLLGRAPYLPAFGSPAASDLAAVDAALTRVGLHPLRDRSARSLSGGERQRLMLARMLVSDARVHILDEPTAALDIGHALAFLAHLRRLADEPGAAVILALHDLDLARRFTDHAVLLGGDRVLTGPVEHVLSASNLGPAFGVTVHERDGHLLFDPA